MTSKHVRQYFQVGVLKNAILTLFIKVFNRIEYYEQKKAKTSIHKILGHKYYFQLKNYAFLLPVLKYYHSSRTSDTTPTIVLMFDGKVYNTGLADRIRSMTSVYYWCKLNSVAFKIYFSQPYPLQNYLIPNEYDWIINKSELDYNDSKPKALISLVDAFGVEENHRLHSKYLDSLLCERCSQIHLYSNTYCYDSYFSVCYKELFIPSPKLNSELEEIHREINSDYITISFRFAQLLGDLQDTYGASLPEDERISLINRCIVSINDIYNRQPYQKVIITSDSMTFLKAVQKLPFTYLIPGHVGHISGNVSEEQFSKTFWDMYIIAFAKKAYMVRTAEMYRSGFAKRATMISDIPFEEVQI